MNVLTTIWTLFCAAVIIGYPIFLYRKSTDIIKTSKERANVISNNCIELLSFDIRNQLPGWSFSLHVPQITEDVLFNNPVLFYLESDSSCLKLPLNNATLGYTANVYKNVGKVYVTFKSLNDGVSNFYVPNWHLKNLKILIIKSRDQRIYGDWSAKPNRSQIHTSLKNAGININDYEDVLGYFSNIAPIDFKGHYRATYPFTTKKTSHEQPTLQTRKRELSPVGY